MFFSLSLSAGLLILLYYPVTQRSVTFSVRSSFSQSLGSCTPKHISNLPLHHLHCYFPGPSHHHLLPGLLQPAPNCPPLLSSFASFPIASHSLCSRQGDLFYIINQILSLLCLKPSNGFTLQALLWFISSPLPVSLLSPHLLSAFFSIFQPQWPPSCSLNKPNLFRDLYLHMFLEGSPHPAPQIFSWLVLFIIQVFS